jgi:hypothetical protein
VTYPDLEARVYVALFGLASVAIIAWLLLILLPAWWVTRRLAALELFQVYLAGLYVVGVVPLLFTHGLGIVRDFGNAEGVTRLLGNGDIALIAWIHILAFDQVVGLVIYRENMAQRYVPLAVQSVLLFITLMLGPMGYLAFYMLRQTVRSRKMPSVNASATVEGGPL